MTSDVMLLNKDNAEDYLKIGECSDNTVDFTLLFSQYAGKLITNQLIHDVKYLLTVLEFDSCLKKKELITWLNNHKTQELYFEWW